jgi:uncharacterized protein
MILLKIKALRSSPGRVLWIDESAAPGTISYRGRLLPLTGPIRMKARAVYREEKQGEIHLSQVEVRTGVIEECSRCLKELSIPIELHEEMDFRPIAASEAWMEEEAFVYPAGADELDLLPYLIGLIISQLVVKPLCRPDCKGLCPHCGHNLNEGPCAACPGESRGDPRLQALRQLLQ